MAQYYESKEQLINDMFIMQDGQLIEHANISLKEDYSIAINAVTLDGWAYLHLPKSLQLEQEICKAAVNQNGYLIRFVEYYDKEIIDLAIKSKPKIITTEFIRSLLLNYVV